jgi:hypothetical protein
VSEELRSSPPEDVRATWWTGVTPGTTYWRCQVPARHLPGQCLRLSKHDIIENDDETYTFPWQKGVAIWQFVGSITRGTVAATMQHQGTPILMEVDDNYLVHTSHYGVESAWAEFMATDGEDWNSIQAHRRYTTWFDGVIVSTPWLAEQYRKFNPNVFICPNSVEPDDWPEPEKPDDGILRIGWAGSSSHRQDAPLVRRALKWASEQDGVEVVILGDRFFKGFEYTHIPWTDTLEDYRKSLQVLDVGLCPLRDNAWSRGKSDVKALEYAMVDALPIVSPTEPYRPWWSRTMVAGGKKDWEAAVRWCVANRDEVKQRAAAAKQYVLAERTIKDSIHLWEEALSCVTAST